MTLQPRDRRALAGLAAAAILMLAWRAFQSEDPASKVVLAAESVTQAERRLSRLRRIAAGVPGKEQVVSQVKAELDQREQSLIQADTAAQAQAQLLQVLRKLARAQAPGVELKSHEIGPVKPLGEDYGEVFVTVAFDAGIEQIVNLLADITAQKELIATHEMRLSAAHPKQKIVPVRLTVSGVVRRDLIPERRGAGTL